jgi:hypothetical protein
MKGGVGLCVLLLMMDHNPKQHHVQQKNISTNIQRDEWKNITNARLN